MKHKIELKPETYRKVLEFQRIGNRAASQAREENRKFGLPNIYSFNGEIVYEMPNGEIVVKKAAK